MSKRRRWRWVAVLLLAVLAACGSDDNGGVIEGPTSTAPRTTGPGYSYE